LDTLGRLVEQHAFGARGHAARDGQNLLLSAAQGAALAAEQRRENREVRQHVIDIARRARRDREILANREKGENLAALRNIGEAESRAAVRGLVADRDAFELERAG